MKKKLSLLAVAILCVFIPYPSLEAPEWKILVVDSQQQPLSGMLVRESYQNYSGETQGHEADLITDDKGQVMFPAKTLWKSPFLRSLSFLGSLVQGGVHASFGPHDYILVFGRGLEGTDSKDGSIQDWTGKPSIVNSVVVAR